MISSRKKLIIAAAILVLLTLISAVMLYARYINSSSGDDHLAEPAGFYFECDYQDGEQYIITLESDFTFQLSNHNGLGGISENSIVYNATVKLGDTAVFTKTDTTISGGSEGSSTVTVPSSVMTEGNVYTVTVNTVSPYEKTVSFEVRTVKASEGSYYTVSDKGAWVQVDIYVGSVAPTALTVNYGSLAPDNTNALMSDWQTASGSRTLSDLEEYAHYTLIFFGDEAVTDITSMTALPGTITL